MYLGGSLYMAGPDIQMNDRMPRTCSSPEAYYAGAKLNETIYHVPRPLVPRATVQYTMTCTSLGEKSARVPQDGNARNYTVGISNS